MAGPYREITGCDVVEAPTRDGPARLEIGPRHMNLEVGQRLHVTLTDSWLTILLPRRGRRGKTQSLQLRAGAASGSATGGRAPEGGRVIVARAVPTEEVALWHEGRSGVFVRVASLQPIELLDTDALTAWRQLERLARRLQQLVAPLGGGAVDAIELGRGQHRVLSVEYADRVEVYVRPLFREHPRRALEAGQDGSILLVGRDRDRRIRCTSRCGVTVLGDRIRFAPDNGTAPLTLWLPWIATEDRVELARRLGRHIDRGEDDLADSRRFDSAAALARSG